jgi:transcriptional regulator with XRE-family HTH domain
MARAAQTTESEHLDTIRTWCDQERGRRAKLARRLEVSPQLVSAWLSGAREISLREWLAVRDIMRKTRARKTEH